jgi:hypothetical protein
MVLLVLIIGPIPLLRNVFYYTSTVCGQQECDFSILGRILSEREAISEIPQTSLSRESIGNIRDCFAHVWDLCRKTSDLWYFRYIYMRSLIFSRHFFRERMSSTSEIASFMFEISVDRQAFSDLFDIHTCDLWYSRYIYSLLHLDFHWISFSSLLNLIGLVSTKRGNKDLENYKIDWVVRLEKWHAKCNRLYMRALCRYIYMQSLIFIHECTHIYVFIYLWYSYVNKYIYMYLHVYNTLV